MYTNIYLNLGLIYVFDCSGSFNIPGSDGQMISYFCLDQFPLFSFLKTFLTAQNGDTIPFESRQMFSLVTQNPKAYMNQMIMWFSILEFC